MTTTELSPNGAVPVDSQGAIPAEDFGEFFDEVRREEPPRGLRNVFGVDLALPAAMPMQFELEMKLRQHSDKPADIAKMLCILFRLSDQQYQSMVDKGMDVEQYSVLLMWGVANVSGNHISLAEARRMYLDKEATKIADLAKEVMTPDPKPASEKTTSGDSSSPTGES